MSITCRDNNDTNNSSGDEIDIKLDRANDNSPVHININDLN